MGRGAEQIVSEYYASLALAGDVIKRGAPWVPDGWLIDCDGDGHRVKVFVKGFDGYVSVASLPPLPGKSRPRFSIIPAIPKAHGYGHELSDEVEDVEYCDNILAIRTAIRRQLEALPEVTP